MYFNRLKLENNHITQKTFDLICQNLNLQKFRKGSVIYPDYNGHFDSIKFIFIKKGLAKSIFFDEGEEFILYLLEQRNMDILGGTCMIEFLEDSEVYISDILPVFDLLKDEQISQILITSIVKKSVLERRIIKNLVFGKSKKKVAYFLMDIASYFKTENIPLDFDLSVQDLANFVGLKRQTVSSICQELLKKNIIKRTHGKHFIINDMEKLKKYAQYDIDLEFKDNS